MTLKGKNPKIDLEKFYIQYFKSDMLLVNSSIIIKMIDPLYEVSY